MLLVSLATNGRYSLSSINSGIQAGGVHGIVIAITTAIVAIIIVPLSLAPFFATGPRLLVGLLASGLLALDTCDDGARSLARVDGYEFAQRHDCASATLITAIILSYHVA